jgi:hypothetical protein
MLKESVAPYRGRTVHTRDGKTYDYPFHDQEELKGFFTRRKYA